MTFDARNYIKAMWEEAPVDDPNKYIREYSTASCNPADAQAKRSIPPSNDSKT